MDNLPLVAEDGPETITQALVAGGVTGSPLDLEPAIKKFPLKLTSMYILDKSVPAATFTTSIALLQL